MSGPIRERLARPEPLIVPGVHDALSAKLAERAGFEAVFISGFGLSASLLGEPDLGFVGMAEVLDATDRIVRAVSVPVIVDIDTGYGNAFHVERVVEGLVARGAAGCFLEDQAYPKRCGHMEQKQIIEVEQYLPKLRAALAARGDAPFFVTARTDARAVLGLDEALARAVRYAEAGADAIFVEAPRSLEEMRAIREALPRDVALIANMVEGGKTPLRSAAELESEGFRFVLAPISGLLAATRAMESAFAELRQRGTTRAIAGSMTTFDELNAITGLPERYAREKAWLR